MSKPRVLISDKLGDAGIEILGADDAIDVVVNTEFSADELKAALADFDGIVIRSGTNLTADVLAGQERLKVIGRAGIGVDNVDLPTATAEGIVVMNTPGGNATTTAEHTIALMMAAARRIPQAHMKLAGGDWDRKSFVGTELSGKTLGIIGTGNIGSLVIERAIGLKMTVLGYDPFLTEERAAQMGIELAEFDEVIRRADVLTLHVPLTDKTRNMIDADQFKAMKSTAILVNCARGGIVNEADLDQALRNGEIAAAAFDVFETEPPASDNPLLTNPAMVFTPHLGASTKEAQEKVAVDVAEQVRAFLLSGEIRNSVNTASVSGEVLARLGPYLDLGESLGRLVSQVHDGPVKSICVRFEGEIASQDSIPIVARIVKGILEFQVAEDVNSVNAVAVASARGIDVETQKSPTTEDYASSITVRLEGAEDTTSATGAVFGKADPRIVRVNEYHMDALQAQGSFLLVVNRDIPGVIGRIGAILGDAAVNIAQMYVGRTADNEGKALTVISTDVKIADDVIEKVASLDEIEDVKQVAL